MCTFFFQDAQGLSALQTSIRFLPSPVSGVAANIVIGLLVSRVRADVLVVIACFIACFSPLPLAIANPRSTYWSSGFIANLLSPIGADSLFTVSNLLITSSFPGKTQGLAGGVFNTISQIGKSVGLALVAVIASSVTHESAYVDKKSPDALMTGYRATFFFCFALYIATLVLVAWGLRRIGKVGHKRIDLLQARYTAFSNFTLSYSSLLLLCYYTPLSSRTLYRIASNIESIVNYLSERI